MKLAIILATLRQRFTSPMRLVFLVVLGSASMLPILLSPGSGFALPPPGDICEQMKPKINHGLRF